VREQKKNKKVVRNRTTFIVDSSPLKLYKKALILKNDTWDKGEELTDKVSGYIIKVKKLKS
jgi:hypothetical protein